MRRSSRPPARRPPPPAAPVTRLNPQKTVFLFFVHALFFSAPGSTTTTPHGELNIMSADQDAKQDSELERLTYLQLKQGIHILDMELWTRLECAQFISNAGLPQYQVHFFLSFCRRSTIFTYSPWQETFRVNMHGRRLSTLSITSLASMNIRDFQHQRVCPHF